MGNPDMKKHLAALALVTALVAPATAQAGTTLTFNPASPNTKAMPGNNDFKALLNSPYGLTRYTSTGAVLTLDTASYITFWFYGSESGYNDVFSTVSTPNLTIPENTPFQNNFASPVYIGEGLFSAGSLAGRLNFSSVGGKAATVGENGFGIFLTDGQTSGGSVNSFWFGYDDQITGADDDYDDMIIFAQVRAAVPEPSTWAMMLLGFGALGAAMRRRKTGAQERPALA